MPLGESLKRKMIHRDDTYDTDTILDNIPFRLLRGVL